MVFTWYKERKYGSSSIKKEEKHMNTKSTFLLFFLIWEEKKLSHDFYLKPDFPRRSYPNPLLNFNNMESNSSIIQKYLLVRRTKLVTIGPNLYLPFYTVLIVNNQSIQTYLSSTLRTVWRCWLRLPPPHQAANTFEHLVVLDIVSVSVTKIKPSTWGSFVCFVVWDFFRLFTCLNYLFYKNLLFTWS